MSARLATTWWAAYGYSRVMLLSATSAKGWMKCSGDGICAPVCTRESSSCDVVGGHRLRYRDSAISLDSIHLESRQRASTTPVRGVSVRSLGSTCLFNADSIDYSLLWEPRVVCAVAGELIAG